MVNEGSWGYGPYDGDAQLDLRGDFIDEVSKTLKKYTEGSADKWSKLALLEFVLDSLINIKYGKTDVRKKLTDKYRELLEDLKKDESWINSWDDKKKIINSLEEREKKLKKYEKVSNENLKSGLNEDKSTVWGLPIDKWEYLSYTMSKGTAQDYIKRKGEPKNVEEVRYCIEPNNSIGFAFYSEKMFAKKTGNKTARVDITDDGKLYCYVFDGEKKRILSVLVYNFYQPLITNLKKLFDKT